MLKSVVSFILILISVFFSEAQIVAFVDESKAVDVDFINSYYPEVIEIARGLDLEIKKIDVKDGAPSEITVTPQLVFQNDNGRSFYVGRYSELSRFKTFLRTVARNPQKTKANVKKNILFHQDGRATTALPLKITNPTGAFTEDNDLFLIKAENAFYSGFSQFHLAEELNLKRTNRLFYVDIHPYFSETGQIYLSYEIYSQFNCVIPVFTKLSDPLMGDIQEFDVVFKELGQVVENQIENLINSSRNGDGFSKISDVTPTVAWSSFDLQLTESEGVQKSQIVADDLSGQWAVLGAIDNITPLIQFNFFAPLDNYAGEVKNLSGGFSWKSNILSGRFEVNTKDVTMGEQTYDENVHKKYIRVKRFPQASFVFSGAELDPELLFNNEPSLIEVSGTFSFIGKDREITALTEIIPFDDDNGDIFLAVTAEFDLNVFEHSKVDGPDGPREAKENMHFQMNFLMNQLNDSADNNSNSK